MATKLERDPQLSTPPSSLRAPGIRIRSGLNDSQESLTTHPLLSPAPSSPDHANSASTPPRYIPYTPRQRPVPSTSSATPTTVSVSPTSLHVHGPSGATLKLQVQNLKAAAQGIGLDNGSIGWAFLEKLTGDTGEDTEWEEIYRLVTTEKATLLLPTEPVPTSFVVTPEIVKDHVAFCNAAMNSTGTLVTLAGLRGSIHGELLTIRSTLSPSCQQFAGLLSSSTTSSTLSSLSPLPIPSSTSLPSYPTYHLISHAPSLPFPPRSIHYPNPPPLPPRPPHITTTSAAGSRIPNPFAGFFSRPISSAGLPNGPALQVLAPITPRRSDESSSSSGSDFLTTPVPVSAYAIDRRIVRKDVGKETSKALRAEVKEALSGLPSWIIDRVISFTNPLHPFPKPIKASSSNTTPSPELKGQRGRKLESSLDVVDLTSPEAISASFQDFYVSLEDDLGVYWGAGGSPTTLSNKRKEDDDNASAEKVQKDSTGEKEQKVRNATERIERCICCLFYDRLFRPSTSDDASHDEALASRVAALNMLDLTLDHLGVEFTAEPGARGSNGLDEVVSACGKELQRLGEVSCRSPKEKAAVLVATHKVVVDGLSRLPPVHLKPDSDSTDHKDQQTVSHLPSTDEKVVVNAETITPNLDALEKVAEVTIVSPLSSNIPSPPEIQLSSMEESGASTLSAPTVLTSSYVPVSPTSDILSTPAPPPRQNGHSVNTDVLLPVIIFSVVKANPAQLVSHLLFTERYRSHSVGGEESFCLINLMAVVEFLENVDLDALGLGASDRVLSTDTLTPIPLAHGALDSVPSPISTLRGKVNQQVGELQTSATKVITGVVDSSFSALRGLLAVSQQQAAEVRPGFGLLRRTSGFSIASMAASLPGGGGKRLSSEEGQQMMEVASRPGSVKEADLDELTSDSADTSEDEESEDDDGDSPDDGPTHPKSDARSIRSFTSMMSSESKEERKDRKSLSDRLASMSALHRFSRSPPRESLPRSSTPTSRPSSLLPARATTPTPPVELAPSVHTHIVLAPPTARFLDCSAEDLRLGEVADLLKEYRRMVESLRALGAFTES